MFKLFKEYIPCDLSISLNKACSKYCVDELIIKDIGDSYGEVSIDDGYITVTLNSIDIESLRAFTIIYIMEIFRNMRVRSESLQFFRLKTRNGYQESFIKALNLVVPPNDLKEISRKVTKVSDLAKMFNVTPTLIKLQLERIGIL